MPKNSSINHILIIGSGPIVIGQACEFDYSGSQAARSLREEGITVTLINSNPATIMTDPVMADHIYLKPLTVDSLKEILALHPDIDAVLLTMGGQSALNLCIEADDMGVWSDNEVDIVGVNIDAINITEDRELFRKLMESIDIPMAPQRIAKSFLEGKEAAQAYGFPLCIRASFTLGGTGAAIVYDKEDFEKSLTHGLHSSPIHEVIIDKALLGWKEYELELLRDKNDNVIIICSIENMDPMGVHTGDSITVAPAMTLSDTTYQRMRDMAIKMMRSIGDFAGGCNVQFAVSPDENEDIVAVEINPRVSRSSALASKATGYPIAKIAAKLAIGYSLDELSNQITKTSSAYFEPTLDYVIVKFPRWNFDKFEGCDNTLGLQMKSVGEVMAIGRSFQEALQKACQSLEINRNGLGADAKSWSNQDQILDRLKNPSWDRVFRIYDAMRIGIPKNTIQQMTGIDNWFLSQIEEMVSMERVLETYNIKDLPRELLLDAKMKGYADRQIAHLTRCWESEVHTKRIAQGINRVYKLVDTCAAEFEAQTPYYYSTFENEIEINGKRFTENEVSVSDKKKVIVLGSGPNRIGQGIEFDYCCVHGVLAAKEMGYETIMINCNPETVSTDFDTADQLFFEPVFWEHIYDIIKMVQPEGVIVQLGGQTALKLAEKLEKYGVKIDPKDKNVQKILNKVKEREFSGYSYDGADASFELLARRIIGEIPRYILIKEYDVSVKKDSSGVIVSSAKAQLEVDGEKIMCTGEGNGPVNALDNAIRQNVDRLNKYSKYLKDLKLVDYKVRILNTGTEAITRVSIESTDSKGKNWFTIGVSTNIIDASFKALIDSLDYKLFKDNAPASL